MLTRRDALVGAMTAGAILRTRTSFSKASQPETPVNFEVPENACDCHTHIHGDPQQFPFFSGPHLHARIGVARGKCPRFIACCTSRRVVIVTPSVYGTDNSATLYGMKARGADARGVAVIDDKTTESDLDAMARAGMRGIRLNLATGGTSDPNVGRQRFQTAVDRMKSRGWHIQMYTNLAVISGIKDLVLAAPVPVVFDHFGGAQAALGSSSLDLPISWRWSVQARLMSKFLAPTERPS